ncbi:carbohydrate-binding module family 48 protein, partial [Fistulina hepatica ATCC 64428]
FSRPHSEPNEVIVTGSFDQWTSSLRLVRTDRGFKGKTQAPWGQKITYKFVVDGQWLTSPDQPTEYDNMGNLNNVYFAPDKP